MTKRRTTPLRQLADYEFPWMPLYIDELQALAAVLGNELLGPFLRLRAYAWHQKPPCTLPDDDRALARISGLAAEWPAHAAVIREQLTPVEGGRLRDLRLTQRFIEQAIRADISHARKGAGKTGGTHSAEARGKQPAKQPASNGASNRSALLGPVMKSEMQVNQNYEQLSPGERSGSESLVRDSESGEATGQQRDPVASGPDPDAGRDWREVMRENEARGAARRTGARRASDREVPAAGEDQAPPATPDDAGDLEELDDTDEAPTTAVEDADAPTP